MKLFKKKSDIIVLKLFKITDEKLAVSFEMKKLLFQAINEIEKISTKQADSFCLNFNKNYNTLKGFKNALTKVPEIVYSFINFDSNKTNTFFSVDNAMLNYIHKPHYSSINLCLQIADKYLETGSIEKIAYSLLDKFNFEYGYIHKMPEDFDALTERKCKGLFSHSVTINEIDHAWTFHKIAILNGYLKKVYKVNFLNKSQFENQIIKNAISKYGKIKSLNEKIYQWELTDLELHNLNKSGMISERLIISKDMHFLNTKDAKKFNNLMKIPIIESH